MADRLPTTVLFNRAVEDVWAHLERSKANLTKHSLDQPTTLVKTRLKRMHYWPGLIDGLIAKTGLDFQPRNLSH
ncbi:hypothetical protein [Streptomyces sp. NPDC059893]|uniref:hypothetical protein n=1 Tax=Streptomyces sp. NPDC059893 TaxID=3346990 RepID=UPI0036695F61